MPKTHMILLNKHEADAITSCAAFFEATPRGGDIGHDGRRDRSIRLAVGAVVDALSTTSPVPRPIRLTHSMMSALCAVLGLGDTAADVDEDIPFDLKRHIRSAHQRIIEAHNHQR